MRTYTADEVDAMIGRALARERERVAQQQEPVVFYRCNGCGHAYEQMHPTSCDCMEAGGFDRVEYYTYPPAQRTWVGLTRAERFEIEKAMSKYYDYQHECKTVCLPEFARAIEAKLREKNGITKEQT